MPVPQDTAFMPNQSKASILIQQKQQAASQDTSPEQLRILAYTSRTLMLLVAENNAAPPELLRELAASSKAVCERVAANPNTPIDVLLKLGAKFPKQLLNNPILPLLLLENPNLIDDIPLNTLINLLKQEQVPEYILNAASKHQNEDVLILVASHINTDKQTLEHLSQSLYGTVQEVAKLHVNLVDQIELNQEVTRKIILKLNPILAYEVNQEDLALAQLIPNFLLPSLHNRILYIIALHPNTPTHLLKILCGKNFYSSIHEYVVSNRNTPVNLIESVAEYYYQAYSEAAKQPASYMIRYIEQVLAAIVSNPNTPTYLIEKIYQHSSGFIHARVAENLNTPIELLDLLANSTNSHVRSCVAANPNTSINSLKKLCLDQDNWVRYNVAGNRNIPTNLLEILAKDKESNIRNQVVNHLNTSPNALSLLAQDENEWIRCNVAKHPNITVEILSALATDKSHHIRQAVALNSKTPTSLLNILAQDESYLVRQAVDSILTTPQKLINQELIKKSPHQLAQNLATPANILTELAKHKDSSVRRLIAANTNTPLETLEILARDKNPYVRYRVGNNPKMPIDKFAKITLERIAKTLVPSFSRFIVFLHHQAPQEALVKNYRSSSWLERYAIAQNPNTPKHILNELTSDANQIVRATASSAIKHI